MKKVTLTEKQKKILKTTVVVAGGAVCVVVGAKVINKTRLCELIKDQLVDWCMKSNCHANGYELQMDTLVYF